MAQINLSGNIPGLGYVQTVALTRGWHYVASWAHRISGVMLAAYAWFHIITISSLSNPEVFKSKMDFFAAYIPGFVEWFLAVPVIFHALNGGRLIIYEIFGNRKDSTVLKWVLILSVMYLALLGCFMLLGNQWVSAALFWTYMGVVSAFLTYLTVVKLKKSGASLSWKLQRISGAFLLLMIPAHMLFMHLDPVVGRDAQVIIDRMDNVFIKLVDLLLVSGVLYHCAYGLISICHDYLSVRSIVLGCKAGIISLSVIFAWMAIKMIVLV